MLTREQYQNLLKTLPEELKEALFSVENLEAIGDICDRNGASQFFESVNREMGDVLFGITLPSQFPQKLADLGLQPLVAQNIATQINRIVFYPVKSALEQIHHKVGQQPNQVNIGIQTPRHSMEQFTQEDTASRPWTPVPTAQQDQPIPQAETQTETPAAPARRRRSSKNDPYRESPE